MIERCKPDTINQVISLGNHWADHFSVVDYEEDEWTKSVRQYSIYDHTCWLNWYNNMNQLVGFIAGAIAPVPHSGVITSQIHYVYIKEEFLDSASFLELHGAFEEWARKRRAVSILAPSGYELTDEYQELFNDLGYQSGATVYVKGLK